MPPVLESFEMARLPQNLVIVGGRSPTRYAQAPFPDRRAAAMTGRILDRRWPGPYTGRVHGKLAGILAFPLALILAGAAFAEHSIEYRYTVLGYVKNARGAPQPGVEVALVREKTGFAYVGETDASGLYVIVARLGDESLGETLILKAGGHMASLTARFDPGDHSRERGTHVDFLGSRSVERRAAFPATLKSFLAQ
jgi:hypothetical protein